ncbi:hypothetical protein FO519_009676 [Halicephalobus sp. NKZ332]|nr:hypothetical protein FO519_009676 [Halicephalobus sp. NKZ332]
MGERLREQPNITPEELLAQVNRIQRAGANNKRRRQNPPSSHLPPRNMEKPDWDPNPPNPPEAFTQHAGGIYEKIKIPTVCFSIIDTPTFQRLNNIEQLGVVDRVFRQAVHTRFEHSLGVAELARKVMKKLRKIRKNITGNDMLCVIIAGLCHDLGCTPFSRSLDPLIYKFNSNFRHREMSVRVFDYMLENEPEVREELGRYLDDTDFEFIREMINPPESFFNSHGNWALEGRPASKQYLYEIVNNVHHGLDIDKLDYLFRDSHHTGVDTAIGLHFISRFIDGIDIQEVDGEMRLTFNGRLADEIPDVFNSRKSLFMKVYFHKKIYPLEYQLQKAIELAADHLKFRGEGDKFKTLRESLTEPIDIEAYIKLDDHILSLIKNSASNHPNMRKAKKCIENMERRELHTTVLKIIFRDVELADYIEAGVRAVANIIPSLSEEGEIIYKTRHYDFGKGPGVDPSNEVLYKPRSDNDERPRKDSHRNLQSESAVFVYGPHDMTSDEADSFYQMINTYLEQQGIAGRLEFMFKSSTQ